MSSEATGWVLRYGPKDRAMRFVLLTIAEAANRDGEHAHPGMTAIIEGSLYGRAHVYKTLDSLIREGWLTVEEAGGGRGKATVFAIPGVRPNGPVVRLGPVDDPVDDDQERSNPAPERVQSGGPTLSCATITEQPRDTPTSQSVEPTGPPPEQAAPSALAVTDPFELFWKQYPPRTGLRRQKAKALAVWQRMTLDDQRAAYRGAGHLADRCAAEADIAPDAFRWLRDRRWVEHQEGLPIPVPPARTNGSRSAGYLKRPGQRPLAERLADAVARSNQPNQPTLPGGNPWPP